MILTELRRANWRSLALVAILGCALFAAFLPATFAHNAWVFSWDSAVYIETADSLLNGRGLSHRVIFGLGPDIWEPIAQWPPIFPMLVAMVASCGVAAPEACLIVTVGASVMSLVLFAHICLRLVKWYLAAPVVAAVAVSNALQIASAQCLSETTFLMFALASTACLVEWARRPQPHWAWLFAAGVFAGLTWGTRNAGLALFAATAFFLFFHILWRRPRDVVRFTAIWGAGVALIAVPWLLRNLATFGRLNPYAMPHADVPIWQSVRTSIEVIVQDMTTSAALARAASAAAPALFGLAVIAVAYAAWRMLRGRNLAPLTQFVQERSIELFIAAYAAFYIALVVIARSRYKINEISSRYMVEIYWIFWLLLAVAAVAAIAQLKMSARARAAALSAVFIVAAGQQAREHWRTVSWPITGALPESFEARLGPDACAYLRSAVGPEQFVLSIRADLVRVHCDVNARAFPETTDDDFRNPPQSAENIAEAGQSGRMWGLVLEDPDAVRAGAYGPLFQDVLATPERHPEFARVDVSGPALILRYVPRDQVAQP